ncbi:MAG: T9SS type A sorting domain-containing protein [Crocinitomicaceae bacterium]|nr:T9SS type A sorting domain-containing protein [Crocinitomicaceae bacterium]
MRHFILTFLCIIALNNLHSQTPGNVSTNLVLWLKPSSFTLGTWKDLSTVKNDFAQGTIARRPALATTYVNYNSVVEFTGSSLGSSDSKYMDGKRILADGLKNFSVFTMAFPKSNNGTYSAIIEFKVGYDSRFEVQGSTSMRFSMPQTSSASGTPESLSPVQTGLPDLRANIGSSVANGTSNLTGLNGVDGTGVASPLIKAGTSNSNSRLGSLARGPLNAYIGDIIVYNSNVSTIERRKIESYLAIKYGVTLGNDYVNTEETTIYTVSAYNKNIIGLGRDDNTTLLQKQSRDASDSIRIYLSTLTTTNAANTGTITNDVSHLMLGNNGGKMASTYTATGEMPAGLFSRLEREWKVTKTNFVNSFSVDLRLSTAAIPGSINPADLRLLVDDDGNFGTGGTNSYYNGDGTGMVISYSSGMIKVANLSATHFPNNSTKYFSIASINSSTPLPIELLYFDAIPHVTSVTLNWKTGSERNNDYFTVERSVNGMEWFEIGRVKGAGSSSTALNYEFFDESPLEGISYYRLKQTDYDGEFVYSAPKSVNFIKSSEHAISIFPNPAMDQFTIEGIWSELKETRIYTVLGQDVTDMTEKVSQEKTRIVFDISKLKAGTYYVKTKTTTNKVMKE